MNDMIRTAVHQYIMALVEKWEQKYLDEHAQEIKEVDEEVEGYQDNLTALCSDYYRDSDCLEDVICAASDLDDAIQTQHKLKRDKLRARKLVAELLDLDKEDNK